MADRWNTLDLADSRHVSLPLSFRDGRPSIEWDPSWMQRI
jgi:hypothetical protein